MHPLKLNRSLARSSVKRKATKRTLLRPTALFRYLQKHLETNRLDLPKYNRMI